MTSVRIVSWNILQGGGRRADEIVQTLLDLQPDIVTLQEFRNGAAGRSILKSLEGAGLVYSHVPPTAKASEHTIMIAARFGFDAGPFLPEPRVPLALLEAYFAEDSTGFPLSLIAMHFPQKKAQVPLFQALATDSTSLLGLNTLLIGDMNSGVPFEDSDSDTFYAKRHFLELKQLGWIDAWRSRHPAAREFSWVSPRTGNRFRYDQCLTSPSMDTRIANIAYDHNPREARHSDHSLMIVDLNRTD